MDIDTFMRGYQAAWQQRDEHLLCSLFAPDGVYHNTPFAAQRGHAAIAQYWQRVKLQEDIHLDFEVLARTERGGVAHWHVTSRLPPRSFSGSGRRLPGPTCWHAIRVTRCRVWCWTACWRRNSTKPGCARPAACGGTARFCRRPREGSERARFHARRRHRSRQTGRHRPLAEPPWKSSPRRLPWRRGCVPLEVKACSGYPSLLEERQAMKPWIKWTSGTIAVLGLAAMAPRRWASSWPNASAIV